MKIKVDTHDTKFLVGGPPRPVLEFETSAPRMDAQTGRALFVVSLIALSEDGAEVMDVKVAGDPGSLIPGQQVSVQNLAATTWEIGDRSGVSFRAVSITAATSPRVTKAGE